MLSPEGLRRLALFEGADHAQITEIIADAEIRQVEEGEIVLRPEMTGGTVFVVLEGRFTVHLGSPDGTAIAVLGPGECAGELSFVDRKRISAYVRAASDCRVLCIEEETMWRLVNESHSVAVNLLHMLARRVRHDNEIITSTAREGERLQRAATVDSLTGVFNRRWMDEMFARALEQSAAEGRPAALLMLDIDHFKQINDDYGHAGGDEMLTEVSKRLLAETRETDSVARWGGDEFLVVLSDIDDIEKAESKLEALKARLDQPYSIGGETVYSTASIGLALYPTHGEDEGALLSHADAAMYAAKHSASAY